MIHFYIDESGTGLRDKRSSQFVLAAAGIHTADLQVVDQQINAFKRRLIPYAEPEDFELKGRDLRRGDRLFKSMEWGERAAAIGELASVISALPIAIYAVQVNKVQLTEYVAAEDQLYALAFRRLLELLNEQLDKQNQFGMLMMDSRSDLHSSVQDRRLIDVYRKWLVSRTTNSRFIELPWFGFSAFYVGLQIADVCAYMIDFVTNEVDTPFGSSAISDAFNKIANQVVLARIP